MSMLMTALTGPLGLGLGDWFQLLLHFTMLSLLAVGGAITTVPDMQRFVVGQQGWLTDAQFAGCIALAQAAPGPNMLFVAVIGYNVGGMAGVLATMVGTLLPSSLLAIGASRFGDKRRDSRGVRAFTAGLAPLTVGLMLATGSVLIRPSGLSWAVAALVAATLWLMLRTKRSPLWAIALGALAGVAGWV
jgi:chromate transporter